MSVPAYAMMNQGNGAGGFSKIFSGLFGDSGSPYEDAAAQFERYGQQGREAQNPFYNAGTGAIPHFQDWLSRMQDPSGFINKIMGQYQQSPFAKFQQQQAIRAANNMGSATGLTGSTPMTQFAEQNARDISSQDMNQWLQNVLGINSQYGAGQQSLVNTGQNSANSITQLLQNLGQNMGEADYGRRAGQLQDRGSLFSGISDFFK
jgi:hypothetical protein